MAVLEAAGYQTLRSAGSHGPFDVIGISRTDILLVQVKCNRWPNPAELEGIREYPCPANTRKIIHRWDDYATQPRVQEIS